MPFIPNHLTIEQVEAVYKEALCGVELCELRGWISRLGDPAAAPDLEKVTRAREAIEDDLKASREQWPRKLEG